MRRYVCLPLVLLSAAAALAQDTDQAPRDSIAAVVGIHDRELFSVMRIDVARANIDTLHDLADARLGIGTVAPSELKVVRATLGAWQSVLLHAGAKEVYAPIGK